MKVKLTRSEFREARDVAYALANHWYGKRKNKSALALSMAGICGEYAAIKCFNDTLGAEPRIKFNTEYENGCDGGRDFSHPSDLTWDAKVVTNGTDHILKTKAQCVIGLVREKAHVFYIIGFAPVSRLRETTKDKWKWIPIQAIKTLFPQHFPHPSIPFGTRKNQPTLASNEVYGGVLGPLIWKLQTGGWS